MTAASLQARLRVPLYRNGYLLIASSATTSSLGLAYWLLAARSYSEYDLGLSAALISSMTLLANLAQLNLKGALNRFLPTAGSGARALTLKAYGVALALAALAGSAFVAICGWVAPDLAPLLADPALAAWFVVSAMAWTIFVLQDSVLAGIRQAGLVPVENLLFSVAKIGLVVVLATAAPTLGAFLAWSAPVVLLIAPVNLIVFRRLIPAHVAATRGSERPASGRRILRYLAADGVAYGMWAATIGVVPLLVLNIEGPAANAQYFVCWSIAYALYLVSLGMCQSLLAESSLDPAGIAIHRRRILRESLALVGAGAAGVVVLAPALLGLLGGDYSEEATETLRALALSAVPFAFVAVEVNVARAEGRMPFVIRTYGVLSALIFALGVPGLLDAGIEGMANAWLAAQLVVALGLVARRHRPLLGTPRRLARAAGRPDWRSAHRLHGGGDVTVLAFGAREAVARIARSGPADVAVARNAAALRELKGFPAAPRLVAAGRIGRRSFTLEEGLPGQPADVVGAAADGFLAAVETAMRPLHDATRVTGRVSEAELTAWVHEPLARVRRALPRRHRGALDPLAAELDAALRDRSVARCTVHGDLWPGNILVTPDGAVSGVVDWETYTPAGLQGVDLAHLRLTTRALETDRELGAIVCEALRRPGTERTLVLLAWLGHVAANLGKSPRYARNPLWVRRNVTCVVALAARQAVAGGAFDARELQRPRVRVAVAPLAAAAGLAAWWACLPAVDMRGMTDLGLVSVLPPVALAGLGLLVAGTALLADRPRTAALGVGALVVTLHATPSIVYPTLRYAWAYKHVGLVDFIERHGAVVPGIDRLPVYHDWPGFFGLDAVATALAGVPAMAQAVWAPPVFNLLDAVALVWVVTGLTGDRRVAWRSAVLFVVASWVGQDYFAPQAFAFLLYLTLCGCVVRWRGRPVLGQFALALLLVAAIVVSHPLTGVMVVIALAVLWAGRGAPVGWLLPAAGAALATWDLTFAGPFTRPHLGEVVHSIRAPWASAGETLDRAGHASDGQALVALAGRGLVLCVLALAAIGVVRLHRAGRLGRAAPLLAVAPVALFAAGDYDGEMLFRVYLFALPFLAVLAANAFSGARVPFAAAAVVLAGLFTFAYYGKDHQYAFTREELAASRFVYTHAPPGTLLIEGTSNYPGQFVDYENVVHVPLAKEPPLGPHPAAKLAGWMRDRPAAYVLLTRSQLIDAREVGAIAPERLLAVRRALEASPEFRVAFRNRDAIVFAVAR